MEESGNKSGIRLELDGVRRTFDYSFGYTDEQNIRRTVSGTAEDMTRIRFKYKGKILDFPVLAIMPMQKTGDIHTQESNTCQIYAGLEFAIRDPRKGSFCLFGQPLDPKLSLTEERLEDFPGYLTF